MRSNSVKALILLGLFSLTTSVQSLFAETVRVRPRTQGGRTEIRKNVAQKNKKPRTQKRTVRKKKAPLLASKKASTRQDRSESAVHIQGRENVFHGLDRDSDGFISRGEWPAQRKSFDILDRNDDGRISLAELRSRQL